MESSSQEPEQILQEPIIIIQNVDDIGRMMQRFGWPDYVVFVVMLLICIAIGIYFGFFKSAKTASEYLVGGRNMNIFPISMSLIASFVSGISLLGIPTEIYIYGMQYLYIIGGVVIMGFLMQYLYLPVFHDLKLTSTFEYLERRFSRKLRLLGSFLCVIGITTWLPVVIYVPALAFNQVTGVNVHLVTPVVCLICIFYTCVGGLKAVVWTDVIQTVIMFGSMILVAVKGTLDIGGLSVVIQRNMDTGRIEPPNLELSIFCRHTIWALVIGGAVYWLQTSSVNQTMIQRYLALPTLKSAKCSLWIFVIGVSFLMCVCGYCGLLIYATYHSCDPITTKLARQKDQLLPLLVMDVLGNIPGFPGVFVAGIFSASLSSLSTGLNSMSAIVLEDFYRPFFSKELSDKHTQIVMKTVVVVFGGLCVALVQVVEKLGTVLQLTMSIGTISSGPSLGIFTMGVLLPWVNATGALSGGIAGLAFMSWLCLRAQAAIAAGDIHFEEKATSTEGCNYHFINKPPSMSMIDNPDTAHADELWMLYRLSYLWYVLFGVAVTCSVGLLVSFATKANDPRDVEPGLLAPIVRRCIKPREYPNQPPQQDIILAYEPQTYKLTTSSSNGIPSFQPQEPSQEFIGLMAQKAAPAAPPPMTFNLLPKIINGGVAGIIGVTCVFPLDLVKTRLQNQTIGPHGEKMYSSLFDCFKKVIQHEGFFGMYRGSAINLILITPEKAIKLAANDFFRFQLRTNDKVLPLPRQCLAGGLAGLFQIVVTTPMELMKIQMQDAGRKAIEAKQAGTKFHQPTTVELVTNLIKKHGVLGFYKGTFATGLRDITFSIFYFPMFATFNDMGPRKTDGSGEAKFWWSLLAGLLAGAICAVAVTPFDVVKTRLQAQGSGAVKKYSGIADCFAKTMAEGPTAFFKGGFCRMVVIAPLFGIVQMIYYIGVGEYICGVKQKKGV